ncbi:MAG: hypothetical protein ACO1OF_05180 [Adhaeribacter sp.]
MKSIMPIKQQFRANQKIKFKYSAVLASLKLAAVISLFIGLQNIAVAQQPNQMEQAKLDIWTETASFVYRDAKMTEPQNIINATTLKQFEEAIRQEDSKSQIYSKLYRPIEQTGTYKRGKDAKTQLDLLIKSINAKLRENEQRMKDINRRQQLSDLYKQLQQIASDYVNPAAAVAGAGLPDDPTTGDESFTAPDGTETAPDTAVESAFAENQLSSLSKKQPQDQTKTTDWMTTAALLLSILSLGGIYFLYTKITALNKRIDQRKKDIEYLTQQVNAPGRKTSGGNGQLSREEIESLVQKAVARETAKLANSPAPAATPKAAPATAPPHEAPKPKVELPAESEEALLNPAPIPVQPEPTPAPAPAPDKPQSKFARVPVNGGFHEQDLYPTQQHDSIYEIRVSRKDPSKAAFRIVPNSPVHRTAIESAYLSLKDASQYQLNNQHATRIITDEPGTLSYQDGFWRIDKKANIHFE